MLIGHMHRMGDDDTVEEVFSVEDTAQIVDLVRVALGELLDPPEPDMPPDSVSEFWLANFPGVITFCGGCGTVTVQILGRTTETVHFAVDMAEHLRGVVNATDPEEDGLVVAYRRSYHPEVVGGSEDQPYLYITRIAYRVSLPETDPVWAMVAEMVNLFDAVLAVFVRAVTPDERSA
jgi:hypothetical protein